MDKLIVKGKDVVLYTETFGSFGSPAILLVSGAMAPAIFGDEDFCLNLSERFLVIRFDLRDMGFSTHFEPCRPESRTQLQYTIDDMVDDCLSIIERYRLDRIHIIGHSLGATIAQLFAIKYPEKTTSLTAISSPLIAFKGIELIETDSKEQESLWAVLMSNKMYADFERGKAEFFRMWSVLNGDWLVDSKMAFEYTQRIYETEKIEPAWNHTEVQKSISDQMSNLESLNMPILFCYGEKDILASNPQNIEALSKHLNAKFYLIPKAGHMFLNKKIWHLLGKEIGLFLNLCPIQS